VTDVWRAVVAPNQVLFIGLLVVFEATVGVLTLSGGRRTQLGYMGVIGFYLALWLFGWIEGLVATRADSDLSCGYRDVLSVWSRRLEHMFEDAVQIRDRLAGLVDRLDPDAMSASTARELWAVLDRSERLCAAGKTLLARRLARTHRPERAGDKTAIEDLARRSGTSTGAARDSLDTSARLPEQPGVQGALRRGEVSLAQAAVISAAVAANAAEEDRLVGLAGRMSVPELREECARVRAAADPDPEATNRRLHRARRLRRYVDGDGFWNLHARGTPQAGAAFNVVLDAYTDRVFTTARRAGRDEPVQAYAFDALMALADQLEPNQGDCGPGQSGDGASASGGLAVADVNRGGVDRRVGEPGADLLAQRVPGRLNPRYLALLRVDVQALHRGRVAGNELCEIRGVGPVPVSVAEGLLGRSVLQLVITRGVDVLNVTHLGRGPTAAQKIALAWASPGCTVEGCWRTRTENDHREPWAQTRHTRLDELDPLCAHHHDLKTRSGWALVEGTGKRPIVPPEHPRHPKSPTNPRPGWPTPAANQAGDATAQPKHSQPAQHIPDRPAQHVSKRPAQQTLPDPPGDPPQAA
jgi:hypothetical protein